MILGYEKDTQIINAKADSDRAEIVNQKLELTGANNEISKLERQLKDARDRKANIENTIQRLEDNLVEYDLSIEQNDRKISELEAEIKDLEVQSDSLKIKYSTLEITVERFRTDLSKSESKEDVLFTAIKVLEEKVNI